MSQYERYGVEVGQVYVPADGSKNRLTVRDVTKYADCGDIVVFDEAQGCERRIDAFKLVCVRYTLLKDKPVAKGGAQAPVADTSPIEWHLFSPRVQSHGLCRYCDERAVAMRKLSKGWALICLTHRR